MTTNSKCKRVAKQLQPITRSLTTVVPKVVKRAWRTWNKRPKRKAPPAVGNSAELVKAKRARLLKPNQSSNPLPKKRE